jgi:REP element-mobilizing transposase RayT
MADREQQRREIQALLSAWDAERGRRRQAHHLPAEYYANLGPVVCVTLCARQHGVPFEDRALAAPTVSALRHYRDRGFWMVYAYCLMPDHLHAVVRLRIPGRGRTPLWEAEGAPPRELVRLVGQFKSYTTTQVAWKHGLPGSLWQRDFYDRIPRGEEEFRAQCRYVLENPVRRGLVAEWREYPWAGIMDAWSEDEAVAGEPDRGAWGVSEP